MSCLIGLLVLLTLGETLASSYGTTVYGKFGKGPVKFTHAVKEKVTWKKAANLCYLRFDGQAALFVRARPEALETHLVHLRYVLQQNGWPLSDHLWTGYTNSSGSWMRDGNGVCETVSDYFTGYFPSLSVGIPYCVVLNMTGTTFSDLWIFRPCDETYDYLCKPFESYDASRAELTVYSQTNIKARFLSNQPQLDIQTGVSQKDCHYILDSDDMIFASVYYASNSTCTIYKSRVYKFPISISLVSEPLSRTVVKTKGHNVTVVRSQHVEVTNPLYENCFNLTELSTLQSTEQREYKPSTENIMTVQQFAENNILTGNNMNTVTPCKNECMEYCLSANDSTLKGYTDIIIDNLKLNKKLLSSYRRSLNSASDDRRSACLIGVSGATILIMAALVIIIPDIVAIVKPIVRRYDKNK